MYHSIKLYPLSTETQTEFLTQGINTWDKFHIVPTSRPHVEPPELKTNEVDIPGSDGAIDLTETPMGYPTYQNRTGSWEFIIMNDYCQPIETADEWYTTYSNIMNYLHGKRFRVVLEDDQSYFYEGRLTASNFVSEKNYSKITINYNLKPYKWSILQTGDDWFWDPFNFATGVIPADYGSYEDPWNIPCWNYNDDGWYTSLRYRSIEIEEDDIGYAPINPDIYFSIEYTEDVAFPIRTFGMYFQLPGWSNPRLYFVSDYPNYQHQRWTSAIKIPEYEFRSDMSDDLRKITCAVFPSWGIPVRSAFTQEELTCENCNLPALGVNEYSLIVPEDSYFRCRCENCGFFSEHKFRYAKESGKIFFKWRQGGF